MVSALQAQGLLLPAEHVATFLYPVRRRDVQLSIGAAVTDRGEIVILVPEGMSLSINEATELQIKIREAVLEAGLRAT